MNSFLENLIDRHQEVRGHHEGLGEGHKVQPRPKARYEGEAFVTANANNDQSDDYGIVQSAQSDLDPRPFAGPHDSRSREGHTADNILSSTVRPPMEMQGIPNRGISNAGEGDRLDAVNERISALAVTLDGKHKVQEEGARSSGNQQSRPKEAISSSTHDANGMSTASLSIEGELNDRIQEILQRLDHQQLAIPNTENEKIDTTNADSTKPKAGEFAEPVQAPISRKLTHTRVNPSTTASLQAKSSEPDSSAAPDPGLLQMPDWLTQMQAELNHRWQGLNQKAETEQVVNVTIGRVEVRAVQEESSGQAKRQKKPSGVLSLDDYLKHRESGGRS